MITTLTHWIDVRKHLIEGLQPVFFLNRDTDGTGAYWVATSPVLDGTGEFSLTRASDHVRVPVFAYRTIRSHAALFGVGVEIGIAALAALRHHTTTGPAAAVLVLGTECHDLPDENAFRCYVGVAFRAG
jgi:hypothetical protein